MESKKTKMLALIALIILAVAVIGATFAYFQAQGGTIVTRNVNVTTHTVDTLTFSIDDNISIEATQQNFTSLDSNLSDEATTTAILTPNSKTGSASKNYYVYLNIPTNGTVYSTANTNSDPELLLQVFDGSNQLVTLTGLGNQKTVNSLTGYDITGKNGLITLINNHEITASNNQVTTENYRVVITLINHNFDQYENTGKQVVGSLIVRETATTFCDVNPTNEACSFSLSYNPVNEASNNVITLTNGYIYHHNENLTNGAGDGSWRYAGANPNNYVCFGSDATECPSDNIYRIIGKIPVDVVTDETDPQNPVIETQTLYKLIRNDYETESTLGVTKSGTSSQVGTYRGPSGNRPSGLVDGFAWMQNSSLTYSNKYSTWGYSSLNNNILNGTVLNNFGSYKNQIAKVIWKVGGNTSNNIQNATTMSNVYNAEITYSGVNINNETAFYNPYDNKTELPNKIGLMYVSDYGYSTPQSEWAKALVNYQDNTATANNWLYRGVYEWTITRNSSIMEYYHNITAAGSIYAIWNDGMVASGTASNSFAVRRVFYLGEDAVIDMSAHAGTLADPYRVS